VLQVSGTIAKISEDYQGDLVLTLQSGEMKAGVNCTLLSQEKATGSAYNVGDQVTIKGVIRAGARYDEDLEMNESIILEKAAIIQP